MTKKYGIYKFRGVLFLACNNNCATAFKTDRKNGLNYGLFKYKDGSFARNREEVSRKLCVCAYCGEILSNLS